MKYKAKDRMALVNKQNMKKIVKYYDSDLNDLSETVNYLIAIAIGELKAIDEDLKNDL